MTLSSKIPKILALTVVAFHSARPTSIQACGLPVEPQKIAGRETVVLLHGMGRSRGSMFVLQSRLKGAGYEVLNFPYVQFSKPMDETSAELVKFIEKNVRTEKYHLVGHSLGNIIARNTFKTGYPPGLGRIVMLAPPNQPAHLAGVFKDFKVFQFLYGDCGQKLSDRDFYNTLPVPTVEFGVIAGDSGQMISFYQPNDAVVTVESTKLDGMKEHITLNHGHTFIMCGEDTFEHCKKFLREGGFGGEE